MQTVASAASDVTLFDGNEQMQWKRQPVSNRLMKSNFWSKEMHTIGKSSLMATPRIYRLIFIRYLYASNSLKHRTRSLPSCPTNKNLFICSFFSLFDWILSVDSAFVALSHRLCLVKQPHCCSLTFCKFWYIRSFLVWTPTKMNI